MSTSAKSDREAAKRTKKLEEALVVVAFKAPRKVKRPQALLRPFDF